MIIRVPRKLFSVSEIFSCLQEGESIHIVGPRRETLFALGLGPLLALIFSISALLGMWFWHAPNEPWFPFLGPLLSLLVSIIWALYAKKLLQKPETESGFHLDKTMLMTFALQRNRPYHRIPWNVCKKFWVHKNNQLWVEIGENYHGEDVIVDPEYLAKGSILLNLPSSFLRDAKPLAQFLQKLCQKCKEETPSLAL